MRSVPCPYEQDVFLSMHGATSFGRRIRSVLHLMACRHCRERHAAYRSVATTLSTLRPEAAMVGTIRPAGARTVRLAVIVAALALAVAAMSYFTVNVLTARASTGAVGESGESGTCGPEEDQLSTSPNAEKPDRPKSGGKGKTFRVKAV